MTEPIYDQSENPRYLSPVAPFEPTEVDERTWADLHTDLATAGNILETLGSVGWLHLAERIKQQIEQANRVMRTSDKLPDIHRAQGAIRACEWLLALPERMTRERQRLSATIASSRLAET